MEMFLLERTFIMHAIFSSLALVFFRSKSKSACILSHFGPHGSYTPLIQWLGEQGQTPNLAPTHDI